MYCFNNSAERLNQRIEDQLQFNTSQILTSLQTFALNRSDVAYFGRETCRKILLKNVKTRKAENVKLKMVTHCPAGADVNDSAKCMSVSNEDVNLLAFVPVYDLRNKQLFVNSFCAKCNGREEKELERFSLEIHCTKAEGKIAEELWKTGWIPAFWPHVRNTCTLVFILPPSLDSAVQNSDGLLDRYMCDTDGGKRCQFDSDNWWSLSCWFFKRKVLNDGIAYMNPFCIECSDGDIGKVTRDFCPSTETRSLSRSSFSDIVSEIVIALSVDPKGIAHLELQGQPLCPDGTFQDQESKVCKSLLCQEGGKDFCVRIESYQQLLESTESQFGLLVQYPRESAGTNASYLQRLIEDNGIPAENTTNCKGFEMFSTEPVDNCFLLISRTSGTSGKIRNFISAARNVMTKTEPNGLKVTLVHSSWRNGVQDMSCVRGVKTKRFGTILIEKEILRIPLMNSSFKTKGPHWF